jgi:hypothetical protein
MKRLPAFVLMVLVGVAVAACARTVPVYNVSSAPVVARSEGQQSTAQVRSAIIAALQGNGWIVKQDNPGKIVAEILVRSHMAEVELDYSTTQYSITYKDSDNLLYNGSTIHRNYNTWIVRLQRQIDQHLNKA